MTDLRFIQIALNTVDLAASVRLYNEVFRYANGGGQVGWGKVMNVQGLDPEGQTLVWWMIGRHPRIQFEIFHHTGPLIRKQREGWSPADHGWVRYGVAVADFDGVLARLGERNIAPLGPVLTTRGLRRFAIRDPWCGIIIEVWEDGDAIPGNRSPENANASDPLLLYATASVADLAATRRYYSEILQLPIAPLERLHAEEDEALWGLAGAKREGFLGRGRQWVSGNRRIRRAERPATPGRSPSFRPGYYEYRPELPRDRARARHYRPARCRGQGAGMADRGGKPARRLHQRSGPGD